MRRFLLQATQIVLFPATAAFAAEIRVPADHPRIQDAVDAAQPGDVVLISRGAYAENVVVSGKTNLRIEGATGAIIRPSGTGITIANSSDIVVLKIGTLGGAQGIDVSNSTNVRIESFAVASVSGDGVVVNSSANVDLIGGRIQKCGDDGLEFGDPGTPVAGGELTRLKVKECGGDGIDIVGSDIVVSFCSVKNVGDDSFEAGNEGAGPVRFERCKSKDAGSDAFDLSSANTVASFCTATGPGDDGFDIEGVGCRAENCKAKGSDSNGFSLEGESQTVKDCVSSGGERGYALISATNGRVENCKAVKNDFGVSLDANSTGNTVTGCTSTTSKVFDLEDQSGGGANTFTSNKFKRVTP